VISSAELNVEDHSQIFDFAADLDRIAAKGNLRDCMLSRTGFIDDHGL
jgi:hypothetical protein